MDIYRFFHPHHNPRLHSTPLRQQELGELAQAAAELRKALERAQKRTERATHPPILSQHFQDPIKAARYLEFALQTLVDVHPGDSSIVLRELVDERCEFSGWHLWTSLVQEQLRADQAPAKRTSVERRRAA